jgi:hypothetical protein
MQRISWPVFLGMSLILLSVILYGAHYIIFQDAHHIYIYMVGDIAFVPIEVLLVTLIIHRLLSDREKRLRLEKLNMVIGTFFSSVGTRLLTYFSDFDPGINRIREHLMVSNDWDDQEFAAASRSLKSYEYSIDILGVNLEELRSFMVEKQDLLVRILENPTLLEHESFSELLRAVFHLSDELEFREDLGQLPDSDLNHLASDIRRAYVLLVRQWVDYVKYLKSDYPFLFSLAMRMNPFDEQSSPLVR